MANMYDLLQAQQAQLVFLSSRMSALSDGQEFLSSRMSSLSDGHEALCELLAASGAVPVERLHAWLHRRHFQAALQRYPCGSHDIRLETVAQAKELMLTVAAAVGLESTAALSGASRALRTGVAATALELATLFPVALYAVGGEAGGAALASVERLDTTSDTWQMGPPLQTPRSGCAAVALGGRIHVLGGCSADGEDLSSVERLDLNRRAWESLPPMRAGRDELAAAASDGQIYAVGGSHLVWPVRHVIDTVERFCPVNNAWEGLPSLSRERCAAAAVAVCGQIYVLGGCDEDGTALDSAECFSIAEGRWYPLPAMPRHRCNFAAAIVKGRVYVIGGYDDRMRDLDVVERFDPAAPSWESVASLSVPRWGVRAVGRGDSVFVVGGHAREEEVCTVDRLEPNSGMWSPLSSLCVARRSFGLAACCDR